MEPAQRDPLLTAGRWLTILIMAILAIASVAMTVGIPVLLLNQGKLVAEIIAEHPEAAGSSLIGPIVVLLAVMAVILGLAFVFMRNLLRIIDSVAQGDPFAPANADRLARMGWLGVAIQAAALPATAIAGWVGTMVDNLEIDAGFSLTGVLLVIILFILARVFRHGAAMRDDLEGTV